MPAPLSQTPAESFPTGFVTRRSSSSAFFGSGMKLDTSNERAASKLASETQLLRIAQFTIFAPIQPVYWRMVDGILSENKASRRDP
jgi:hypothetical protein